MSGYDDAPPSAVGATAEEHVAYLEATVRNVECYASLLASPHPPPPPQVAAQPPVPTPTLQPTLDPPAVGGVPSPVAVPHLTALGDLAQRLQRVSSCEDAPPSTVGATAEEHATYLEATVAYVERVAPSILTAVAPAAPAA